MFSPASPRQIPFFDEQKEISALWSWAGDSGRSGLCPIPPLERIRLADVLERRAAAGTSSWNSSSSPCCRADLSCVCHESDSLEDFLEACASKCFVVEAHGPDYCGFHRLGTFWTP